MSSYEVVAARRGGRHRHHRQPQPVGRQRVQGQGPDRRGRRPRTSSSVIEARLARQRRRHARSPAVRRRRGGRAGRAVRPVRRATSGSSAARVDLDALRGGGHPRARRSDVGRRRGWISRLLAGGRIRVDRDPPGAQPVLRRRQSRADPPEHRRGARHRWPAGGYDLGLLLDGDADRAGAADERGTFIHQLEVTGPADVLPGRASRLARAGRGQRQQHVDGRAPRRALRDRHPRDAGRVQVHRPEDDRDRGDDGRRGVGRVRLRDAPARARRHLRRPAAARPVPARAGGRALAGLAAPSRTSTSSPARRSTGASTSTSTGPSTPRRSDGCWSTCAADAADRARRRSRSPGPWRSTPSDGFKFFLDDGSWLLIRASGTEPLVRVYTEATSAELRDALLVAGERLVRGS